MGESRKSETQVTEHEGMLLSLIARQQPVTAYQLYKVYEASPVTSINTSKGQIYPAIRRLAERKLIEPKKVSGDRRNAEELTITTKGMAALRTWTRAIRDAHIILDDPLRTRLFTLDLLTREERLEWAAKAKELVRVRMDAVESYNAAVEVPHQRFAYQSVMDALQLKMKWLDELLYDIASTDS